MTDDGAEPQALRDVFSVLEHDGYLRRAGDRYQFVSTLLRDWWRSRFEIHFTPVARRHDRS
jgi:hypothetical protein